MKITFTIDPEYDKRMMYVMLSFTDWEFRAKSMGIERVLAERIHHLAEEQKSHAAKELLTDLVSRTYAESAAFIEKSKDLYQSSWNEIEDAFSKRVEMLTIPWFYPEYTVVVTHFNRGLRDPNGYVVGRWWKENPYTQRRLTAYEIIQAHFISIHEKLYTDSGLTKRQVWALAEIASNALTGLDEELHALWPWDTAGYYTDHNYPQFVELQNNLLEPYLKRKNFDDYVKNGIKLAKKYFPLEKQNVL